jgi:hypothetical protein
MGAPVIVPLKTYPLKVVNGRVYVQVSMAQAEADAKAQAKFGT